MTYPPCPSCDTLTYYKAYAQCNTTEACAPGTSTPFKAKQWYTETGYGLTSDQAQTAAGKLCLYMAPSSSLGVMYESLYNAQTGLGTSVPYFRRPIPGQCQ